MQGQTTPSEKLAAAVTPTRSVTFYTLTATIPIVVIAAVLLLTPLRGLWLVALSVLGAVAGMAGLGRLLYELTYDVAGFPNFKLPLWSVFYLVIYLLSAFAFIYFAIHVGAPGSHFTGFETTDLRTSFMDALYLSVCFYLGDSPDSSYGMRTLMTRFLTVFEGLLAMFINVVIITKFVNTF